MTVLELGERPTLARIQARLNAAGRPRAGLVVGIGDDAAVVTPTRNRQLVLTTDASVEGVHFDWRFSTPTDVGYRALAVNLSDLAAMGAEPRWALLSFALPDRFSVTDLEELVDGIAALAAAHSCTVIGGNLTRTSGAAVVDVTAVGEAQPRRVLTRSGGRPGDALYLSGTIGAAAAGLEMLREGLQSRRVDDNSDGVAAELTDECVSRYRRPEARVRLGLALGRARAARAAMDLSDGLADAAHQVGEASECGIEIDADALPIHSGARAWWNAAGRDAVAAALSGGDDYELLFAVPRTWHGRLRHVRSRVAAPPLTRVGRLTKDRSARVLVRNGKREELPRGFAHWGERRNGAS